MSNVNSPFGARVVGHLYGSPYNARVRSYITLSGDSTALYVGDFVKLVENGATNEYGVILPAVTIAAATEVLAGVVVAVYRNPNDLSKTYRPASAVQTVYVCDDPYAIFEIQSSGSPALTDIGKNADIVVGSPNTVYQESGSTISGTMASSTAQLRIFGFSDRPNNEVGQYAKLNVMINEHIFKQTAGV